MPIPVRYRQRHVECGGQKRGGSPRLPPQIPGGIGFNGVGSAGNAQTQLRNASTALAPGKTYTDGGDVEYPK